MATDRQQAITFGELIEQGVLDIGDGYRAKNEELGGSGLIFLRAGHVTETHVHFEGADRFDETLTPRLQAKLSKPGDAIVTTKGNSTGRTAFVTAICRSSYTPRTSATGVAKTLLNSRAASSDTGARAQSSPSSSPENEGFTGHGTLP